MTEALARQLSALVGPGVAVAAEPITDDRGLWPGEAAALARAVPARRAEFAAGRRAARAAFAQLGRDPAVILLSDTRAPVWPAGLTGSITHHADVALAAVGSRSDCGGIGIDLTDSVDLPRDLWPEILIDAEVSALPEDEPELAAKVIFAAKEALFKALFPQVGRVFGFDSVRVDPALADGRFLAEALADLGPFRTGARFAGRFHRTQDRILAAVVLISPK